jgi:MFS family permease
VTPDFRRYLAARLVSVTGGLVAVVALPVLVYQLTGSAGWTAAIAAAEALPYLAFGLLAGALADHVDRRRVMIAADLASAALLATVPLAWWAGMLGPWQVLVVAVAVQTAFVFFDGANFGALPTLVGKNHLTSAYSTLYGTTTVAELVVPPLAGLAVAVVAPAPLIAVNAVAALASALLVRSVAGRLSPPGGSKATVLQRRGGKVALLQSTAAQVGAGLAFVREHPVVRTLTLVGTTHAVAAGAWVAMLVPWADRVLGIAPTGDARLAVLFSCWGVGGIAASRIVPSLSRRLGGAGLARRALPVSLACAVLVIVTPATGHWLPPLLAATAWGAAHSTVVLNAITYRQQVCPDAMQARVGTTARMLSWGVGQPAGALLAGAVATGFGPTGGLAAGAAVLAAGVVVAYASPALRTEPAQSGAR